MKRHCFLLVLAIGLIGCGDVEKSTKEKPDPKIDTVIEKTDAQRADIEKSMKAFRRGIDGFRKAKIKAKVKNDQIQRKIDPLEEEIARIESALKKLRDPLAKSESLTIGSKSYSPEELQDLAQKLIEARKDQVDLKDGLLEAQARLQKAVSFWTEKQRSWEKRLARLDSQITEIDAKREALMAIKNASAGMGEETSMGLSLDELERKIDDLAAETEAQLIGEDEKLLVGKTEEELESVASLVRKLESPKDKVAEIDRILGKNK